MSKKLKINGLSTHSSLSEAANVILKLRLTNLISDINKYFIESTPENLHRIRISLRRLRYNLESFFICFETEKYLVFYKEIEKLQDLTGELRDLDVLIDNIEKNFGKNEKFKFFKIKIENKREKILENLNLTLMEFLHSKCLKEFKKLFNR